MLGNIPGSSKQVQPIALDHAQLAQPRGQLLNQLLVLGKAQVGVLAQLKIGPFLVHLLSLAIDDLLHLLGLLVRPNDLARAHGFRVAELAGATPY